MTITLLGCGGKSSGTDGNAEAESAEGGKFLLFVGTYTKTEPHVDGKGEGIYQMTIDKATGQLAMQGLTKDAVNPSYLAITPDRKYLYAVNEVGPDIGPEGWVAAFRIEPTITRPVLLDRESTHGHAPCHLAVDKSGRFLAAANYAGGLAVFPINADGSLESSSFELQLEGSGPHSDQNASHPHMICFSPDNRYVYVPDKGADRVFIFLFDNATGHFVPAGAPSVSLPPGAGPRHMEFHPNGRFAYVINELSNTVVAYRWDPATGLLQDLQTIPTLPADFTGDSFAADIHVSPDGKFLYGSNRGHNSIVIYRIDPEAGTLTLVGHEPTRGEFPRNFLILPNGEYLYVANQNTDNITIFRRDSGSGKLNFTGQFRVPTPVCLKVW